MKNETTNTTTINTTINNGTGSEITLEVKVLLTNTWGDNPEWATLILVFKKNKDELRLVRVIDKNSTRKSWRPIILVDAVLRAYLWLGDHGYRECKFPQTRFAARDSYVPAKHGKHPTWGVWLGENPVKNYRKSQCVDSAQWLRCPHLSAILRCRAQELIKGDEQPLEGEVEIVPLSLS